VSDVRSSEFDSHDSSFPLFAALMSVRVRFAPSPTGYLHVGGLRTALYNYLFARKHGGTCILRIEDTDRTRLVEGAVENLVESLRWAGIEFDEGPAVGGVQMGGDCGPYVQSERFAMYSEHAMKLVATGGAYYAFDTAEELDAARDRAQKAGIAFRYDRTVMRNQYTLGEQETERLLADEVNAPRTVRMKVPLTGEVKFDDLVRGTITVPARDVDDQILLKSDGFPTYHLANIVDDHFMRITHVIRGEEWLPSTPKHVLLYDAFGWERPQFAHLPLLLNPDKTKLSKRQGDVAVEDYRDKGYFREALVNFVALLGWNPSADREIFTIDELIEAFALEKVNKAGAVFDVQKLDWMNGEYLRAMPLDRLYEDFKPIAAAAVSEIAGLERVAADPEYTKKVIELVRERVHRLTEIPAFAPYMFAPPTEFEVEYQAKHWTNDLADPMRDLRTRLAALPADGFTSDAVTACAKDFAKESGVKSGTVMNVLRLMATGRSVGASMTHTLEILGQAEVLKRVDVFLAAQA
jgi:glutamyl-tRNA synthetase